MKKINDKVMIISLFILIPYVVNIGNKGEYLQAFLIISLLFFITFISYKLSRAPENRKQKIKREGILYRAKITSIDLVKGTRNNNYKNYYIVTCERNGTQYFSRGISDKSNIEEILKVGSNVDLYIYTPTHTESFVDTNNLQNFYYVDIDQYI